MQKFRDLRVLAIMFVVFLPCSVRRKMICELTFLFSLFRTPFLLRFFMFIFRAKSLKNLNLPAILLRYDWSGNSGQSPLDQSHCPVCPYLYGPCQVCNLSPPCPSAGATATSPCQNGNTPPPPAPVHGDDLRSVFARVVSIVASLMSLFLACFNRR